jgi:acetyl esterase/lipase
MKRIGNPFIWDNESNVIRNYLQMNNINAGIRYLFVDNGLTIIISPVTRYIRVLLKLNEPVKSFIYLLIFIVCISGCTHPALVKVADPAPFETYTNVLYGSDTEQQIMDVYLPMKRDRVNTPVLVLIHGGSWVQGSKGDFISSGMDTFFTAHGLAVCNINYRLDQKYKYPAPVDDIGLVLDYIMQHAAGWNINPDRVCLLGKSSGSQLALMYAYSRNADGRVKVVVDGYGPTNFTDSSIAAGPLGVNVTVLLGPYLNNQQSWHDASPIYYMAGAVPTIIFQGTADQLVYPIQSNMLRDSLLARGKPCMFINWEGSGHGWNTPGWEQWKYGVLDWIKRYL